MASSSLSLSTLPIDVIRNIIRSNVGDGKNGLRLISRTWNAQVVEYLTTLPPIVWACFMENSPDLYVHFHVESRYLAHFLTVCPKVPQFKQEKINSSLVFVGFLMPMKDANQFFCRFFKSTNHIHELSIFKLDKNTMDCICSSMGTIKIEILHVIAHSQPWQDDFRKIIMKLVRKHRIDTLMMDWKDYIMSDRQLRKLLSTVPQSVLHISFILARNVSLLTQESKQSLSKLAEETMKKRGVKRIHLQSGQEFICYKIDPIFRFLGSFESA